MVTLLFFSLKIGINVVMPANGETVTFPCVPSIPVDLSIALLKRHRQQACEYISYTLLPVLIPRRHCAYIPAESNRRLPALSNNRDMINIVNRCSPAYGGGLF